MKAMEILTATGLNAIGLFASGWLLSQLFTNIMGTALHTLISLLVGGLVCALITLQVEKSM